VSSSGQVETVSFIQVAEAVQEIWGQFSTQELLDIYEHGWICRDESNLYKSYTLHGWGDYNLGTTRTKKLVEVSLQRFRRNFCNTIDHANRMFAAEACRSIYAQCHESLV